MCLYCDYVLSNQCSLTVILGRGGEKQLGDVGMASNGP